MSRPFKWSINGSYEHFRLDGTMETNDVEYVVWINNTELSLKSDIHKWSFLSFHWSYMFSRSAIGLFFGERNPNCNPIL